LVPFLFSLYSQILERAMHKFWFEWKSFDFLLQKLKLKQVVAFGANSLISKWTYQMLIKCFEKLTPASISWKRLRLEVYCFFTTNEKIYNTFGFLVPFQKYRISLFFTGTIVWSFRGRRQQKTFISTEQKRQRVRRELV